MAKFFDPDGLSRLGNLELIARQVVEGFLTGRHRSPYHGFSVEYLDHRPYVPGDELRSLDWKILARTDKRGFPVPYVEWAQGPLRDFIGERIGYVPDVGKPWERQWWIDLCQGQTALVA